MNTIYRLVWSTAQQAWVVASEFASAKGKGKDGSSTRRARRALMRAGGMAGAFAAALVSIEPAKAWTVNPSAVDNPGIIASDGGLITNTAIGNGAQATNGYSVAIGQDADASGVSSTAIGNGSQALSSADVAIGAGSLASGSNSVALGTFAKATNSNDVSVGFNAKASGGNSGAFGNASNASGDSAFALGGAAQASNNYSLAVGVLANSSASKSVALGYNAVADVERSVALGDGAKTAAIEATLSVTLDGQDYAFAGVTPVGTVSVGDVGSERTLTNVAAGRLTSTSTDAVNGSQLFATNQAIEKSATHYYSLNDAGTQEGNYNNDGATAARALAAGVNASAAGISSTAIGENSQALLGADIAIGAGSLASGSNSVALGAFAKATGGNDVSVGFNAKASGGNSGAFGSASNASGNSAFALGGAAQASNNYSLAVGVLANSSASKSVALGYNAVADVERSVALGDGAKTNAVVATTGAQIAGNDYAFAGVSPVGTVSVGDANAERTVTNVAAGRLNADSTDAINGSQLAATNQAINDNKTHYYSLNDAGTQGDNYNNDGAMGVNALAAGVGASSNGQDSLAIGTESRAIGDTSMALGKSSQALFNDNIAIGNSAISGYSGTDRYGTYKVAEKATAIGFGSQALGNNSVALGTGAIAGGQLFFELADDAIAIGANSRSTGLHSVSIGSNSFSGETGSIAIGDSATVQVTVRNGVALGKGASVINHSAEGIAIGTYATVTEQSGIAIGNGSRSLGDSSISLGQSNLITSRKSSGALGNINTVSGSGSYSVGDNNIIASDNTMVLGNNIQVNSGLNDSVVLGNDSTVDNAVGTSTTTIAGKAYTFAGTTPVASASIGSAGNERTLTNLAAGRISNDSTDGVNGSQLFATNQAIEDSASHYFSVNDAGTQGGNYNNDGATGARALAAGVNASASGVSSTAIGHDAQALSGADIAIGAGSLASGSNSVALGTFAKATNGNDVSVGFNAKASGGNSGAFGNASNASGQSAFALGGAAQASNNYSLAVGVLANSSASKSVALGYNAVADVERSVALGDGAKTNAVVATTGAQIAGNDYAFAGVSPVGTVSVGDANAERTLTNVAAGRLNADSTDGVNGSQLFATNQSIDTLGTQVDTNTTNIANNTTNINGLKEDALQWDAPLNAYSANHKGNGPAKITNVSAGDLTDTSTDAVNGSQLFATNQAIEDSASHYFSVNDDGTQGANYKNDGATGARALAAGVNASASGVSSTAIGHDAQALSGADIAIGAGSLASGSNSVALGTFAKATNGNDVSVGFNAKASGGNSGAFGNASNASGDSAFALGGAAQASNNYSLAVGVLANSSASKSVALGYNAVADVERSVALGDGAKTNAVVATTGAQIAGNDYAFAGVSPVGTVSVGDANAERTLTNVAAGRLNADSTDGVNGSQLFATNQSIDTLGTQVDTNTTNIANNTTTIAGNTTAITNLGDTVDNIYNTGTKYFHANSTGTDSVASGIDAVAIGMGAIASADGSIALGAGSLADGSTLSHEAYLVGGTAKGEVNVGDRRITGLAAGADDMDAVNVAQLKATAASSVADVVKYDNSTHNNITLGGDTYDNSTHTGGTTITNVADGVAPSDAVNYSQLTETNNQVTTNTTNIANNTTNINGLKEDALQWDATLNAYSADHMGNGPAKITNVAAGDLTNTSTDAVNGSQLKATNDQVDINTTTIAGNTTAITNLGDTVDSIYNTGTKYFHANSTGTDSVASGIDAVAIGMGAIASADGSIALGAGSLADGSTLSHEAYLVGGTAKGEVNVGDRRITGLAAGADDADAVNVAQLKQVAIESVADAVKYDNSIHNRITLGDTTYDNSTHTGGTTITNVADGVAPSDAVNYSQLTETNNQVTTNTTNINGLKEDALQWDATLNAYSADHMGNGPAKITNVAAGDLTNTSTDAVNGSQLKATNDQVDINTTTIAGNTTAITNLGDTVDSIYNTGTKYFHANSTGIDSVASGIDAVAIGMGAIASADGSIALGAGSLADGSTLSHEAYLVGGTAKGEVNVGDRRITGLAAGADDADAVNVAQLKQVAIESVADAVKYDNSIHNRITLGDTTYDNSTHTGGTTITNVADGKAPSDAVNYSQLTETNNQVAINTTNITNNTNDINGLKDDALQWDAKANGGKGAYSANHMGNGPAKITNVAVGDISATSTDAVNGSQLFGLQTEITNITNNGVKYFHANSTAADSKAVSAESIAVGGNAQASGVSSIAMGSNAQTSTDHSVAIGGSSSVTGKTGTAIGDGSVVTADNAVALGAGSVADRMNSVSVGSKGNERQITNVAAGTEDTDAVNLAQLKQVSGDITNIDNSVKQNSTDITNIQNGTDGMFQVNNTDKLPKPSVTGNNSVAGGAGSKASGNNSMAVGTSSTASGANSVALGNGSSATADNSVALGSGSVADRTNSVSVGSAGNERQITNVAAGTKGTDGVNVNQLTSGINESKEYTNSKFSDLKNQVDKQNDKLEGGIAGAMAMASMPQPYSAGASMFSMGGASYGSQGAVAMGVSTISDNGKWVTKLQGTTTTQGDVGVAVGVGYQW